MTDDVRPPIDPDDLSLVSAYLDAELDADERSFVESQLATSTTWRDELDAVQVARRAVRALGMREAPPGFWERVTTAVAEADAAPPAPGAAPSGTPTGEVVSIDAPSRRTRRGGVSRWAAGAVAAAAVLGAVLVIPDREQVRPDVTAVVARHSAATADLGDRISGLAPLGAIVPLPPEPDR